MSKRNEMKSTRNKKKEDGTFRSKHVKHDPQAESARAVFGVGEDANAENRH
ncbi:MAG TPA: CPC_1213 family protein [Clostridia bacterium]|nr:CPC_1213 family protein [Clostridia bacterium]